MSDEDLIRRGDAILSVKCALNRGVMEQRLRSLPAVPPSPAERRNCLRLRIDKDDTMGVTIWHGTARVWMDGDSLSGEEWASTDLASVVRWIRAQTDQFTAAYRAAKPASTGAAPPAAEPGVTRTRCTIIQTAPTPLQFDPEEPAAEPAPRTTTTGAIVSALSQMGLAQLAEPAKPDLPWGTDIGPSDYMTPAADPASFQKPGSFLDEAAVRCNNPEPAAQPFRHGRCCAEEPKEPAPCGTCGGSGRIGRNTITDGLLIEGRKPCPSCSHGGAA